MDIVRLALERSTSAEEALKVKKKERKKHKHKQTK